MDLHSKVSCGIMRTDSRTPAKVSGCGHICEGKGFYEVSVSDIVC